MYNIKDNLKDFQANGLHSNFQNVNCSKCFRNYRKFKT